MAIQVWPTMAPVVVDHDEDRVVGRVLDLHKLDFSELGGTRWLTARVLTDDDAPGWLRMNAPASISFKSLWRRDVLGWDVVKQGIPEEISVLSPGVRSAEPLARVVTLSDEVSGGDGGASDVDAPGELIHGGPLIRRPGIGDVLGVR